MTRRKRRITLITGPEMVEAIDAQSKPLAKRFDELSEANAADRKKLAEITRDPYANLPPHTYTPLSEIQAWVKQRDEQSAPIQERIDERNMDIQALAQEISGHGGEKKGIQAEVDRRRKRLEELKAVREREEGFAKNLGKEGVMQDFIELKSRELLFYLDSGGIELPGWDKVDRKSHALHTRRIKPWIRESEIGDIKPLRLASVKTLAAVYGQLCREVGYPRRKSFDEGLVSVLQGAQIRRVLEVGPGSRGLLSVLAETGIAERAGLELSAVDMQCKPGVMQAFRDLGIQFVVGNAVEAGRIFKDTAFDLILAVGVMSGGGIQDGEGAEDYAGIVEKSHGIADGLAPVLSENPHAFMACSGIHGTMTLFKDRLTRHYKVAYWQSPCQEARENDREKAFPDCPNRPGELHPAREQGRLFKEWLENNRDSVVFANRLFDQSTDLAVLKKK